MTPETITLRAGTNRPVTFTVDAAKVPIASTFELVVQSTGLRRVYGEGSGLTKSQTGQTVNVVWTYSLADSRLFPIGRIATAELQWSLNGVQDSDVGNLDVLPGTSND
jgi:hypothetical protein